MSEWLKVGKTTELADGGTKGVVVQGHEILIARAGDLYFAAADRCPHMGARLSSGSFEGTVVTCPRHGSQFDLRDGRVVRWLKAGGAVSLVGRLLKSPRPLTTYPVRLEGDSILVEIQLPIGKRGGPYG
jgi:3-phenylpropionate/trans-cinnamate dioxygenase ferredoxin subunit